MNIKADFLSLKGADIQTDTAVHYTKDSHFKVSLMDTESDDNTKDTVLDISREAQLRLQNQIGNSRVIKRAGITSAREQFEIDAIGWRTYNRSSGRRGKWAGGSEAFQLDEPETYEKSMELESKAREYEWRSKEYEYYMSEAHSLQWDWYMRRCFDEEGNEINPAEGKCTIISTLQNIYSNSVHDTSFDCYSSGEDSRLWRFGTKFTVIMPVKMLSELETVRHMDELSGKEQDEIHKKMNKIDQSVNEIKEVEKNYEGNLTYLRFGVKFDDEGSVTYHANYEGCEDKNGIKADSAEELLEKLMSVS